MLTHLLKNKILYTVYALCFCYLLYQPAIYTPDTSSYMQGSIWRSAGYPTFIYVFRIFGTFFNFVVVGFQLIISFIAIHLFTNKISQLLSLPIIIKYMVVAIFIFPLFPPLYIANNICSEGLSYPIYLFFLYFGLHFIFNNKYFWQLFLSCTLLILTRGQFVIIPILLVFIYAFNFRKTLLHKSRLFYITILVLSIFFSSFINKSFHKITRDLYISTPFTYIAMSGAAMYVSQESDATKIINKDYKIIFKDCYAFIKENDWVLNAEKRTGFKNHYRHFHEHLSKICNYTVHDRATKYFENKGYKYDEARAKSDAFAKAIYPVLVKNNFLNYIKLYYENVVHGFFKSRLLLWLIVLLYGFSIYKMIKTKTREYTVLFFILSLILSNALIVSLACHSIMRYLFYNYSLILIAIFQCFKSVLSERKN